MVTAINYQETREEDDSFASFFFPFAHGKATVWNSVSVGIKALFGEKEWGISGS